MTKRGKMPKDTNPVELEESETIKPRTVGRVRKQFIEDGDSTSQMLRIWSKDWDSDEDQSNRVR
jgi:hypothetical protein